MTFYSNDSPKTIRATLSGSNRCRCAGFDLRAETPILEMCRRLVAAGFDPDLGLECFRKGELAIVVRSIGQAAQLVLNSKGTGFIAANGVRIAPPVRQNGSPLYATRGGL